MEANMSTSDQENSSTGKYSQGAKFPMLGSKNGASPESAGEKKNGPAPKKPPLKNPMKRRISRNFIEMPLPSLDPENKTATQTHPNELHDYLIVNTSEKIERVPGTSVPKLGQTSCSNSEPPSRAESRVESRMENFGQWKWTTQVPISGHSNAETLGQLMEERVYRTRDLEQTMEKLDDMYKQQTTLSTDLKQHRVFNDKLQEKLQEMESALERAHKREAELEEKIKEKEEMCIRVDASLAEAADKGQAVTTLDLAKMQLRAKELEDKEQDIEEKIRHIEETEENYANRILQMERELKQSKWTVRQLDQERDELERQLAEATPHPTSRLSLLSEQSSENGPEKKDKDNEEPDNYMYKPKNSQSSKEPKKRKKKTTKSGNNKVGTDSDDERPSSRACVIL